MFWAYADRARHANGAAASFQRTLQLDPTNFAAAYDLGALEVKQNHVPEGMHHFGLAVQINPNFVPALEALGELDLYLHHNDDAVRALEHAVEVAPDFAKAHYNLGLAYQAVGRPADAQKEFARAQSLRAP